MPFQFGNLTATLRQFFIHHGPNLRFWQLVISIALLALGIFLGVPSLPYWLSIGSFILAGITSFFNASVLKLSNPLRRTCITSGVVYVTLAAILLVLSTIPD